MHAFLTVRSSDLPPEALQKMTRDLCQSLNRDTGVQADLPELAAEPGSKGGAIEIGTIALAFISSGAAVALFQVCKAYFERHASLVLEFQREDGEKLSISAQNLKNDQVDQTLQLAEKFFGDAR